MNENEFVIAVDPENSAETWWAAARASQDAPPVLQPLLDQDELDAIAACRADAEAALAWAGGLPGWDDGPEYAPHPLVIRPDPACYTIVTRRPAAERGDAEGSDEWLTDDQRFESLQEALNAIAQRRALGGEWATAEYAVLDRIGFWLHETEG